MDAQEVYFEKVFELLFPLEKRASNKIIGKNYTLGIAKENEKDETRVSLTPDIVSMLVSAGFKVKVENDAGKAAKYFNEAYVDAGAEIVYNRKEVFQSNILFKVQAPVLEEIEWMKKDAIILSLLHSFHQTEEYFSALSKKRITAFCYEQIKDEQGGYPFLKAMSEIAGRTLFTIASEYLYRRQGNLLGNFPGIPATKVVMLGAGNVVTHALKMLACSGCSIEIFDRSIHRLSNLQSISHSISTALLHNTQLLEKSIANADVVIAAIHSHGDISPCIITEDMVKSMKEGALIIDVSIDQGGCIETSIPTTLNKPSFSKYGITHFCMPNISTLVPNTASWALSNILVPFLYNFCNTGDITLLLQLFHQFRTGCYLYKGILTNRKIANKLGIKYQDINLLLEPRLG